MPITGDAPRVVGEIGRADAERRIQRRDVEAVAAHVVERLSVDPDGYRFLS